MSLGLAKKTPVCMDDPSVQQCTWKKMAARRCPKDNQFQRFCCATCKNLNGKCKHK